MTNSEFREISLAIAYDSLTLIYNHSDQYDDESKQSDQYDGQSGQSDQHDDQSDQSYIFDHRTVQRGGTTASDL